MMNLTNLIPTLAEMTPQDFAFDYSARVPASTFAAVIFGLILLAVPTIWLLIHIGRRFVMEAMGFGLGMVASMVSMILFPLLVTFLLNNIPALDNLISGNSVVKAVVYSLLTVLPVFATVYFGLKLCMRKMKSAFAVSALFGIGFGIIPMVTSGIPTLMSYLSAAMNINQGKMEGLIAAVIEQGTAAEDIQKGLDGMKEFIEASPLLFLSEPAGLFLQFIFHLGVCILTGGFLAGLSPRASLTKAICLEALYSGVLIICQLNNSPVLAILLNLAVACASAALAYLDLRAYMHEDWNRFLAKPDPSVHTPPQEQETPKKRMPKIVMPKD